MNPLRTLGRIALSWVFVSSGVDVWQHPDKPADTAKWLFDEARAVSPVTLPADAQLVRVNAAVQVIAGAALALGVAERRSAAVLVGSLLPTTVGGHAYWRHEDPLLRKTNRTQFGKNVSLLGGLLVVLGGATQSSRARRSPRKDSPS